MKLIDALPITLISDELISTIERIKELMRLDFDALNNYKRKHAMRRKPVPLTEPLPLMPQLPATRIPTSVELIAHIINFHMPNVAVIELGSQNLVVHFVDAEIAVTKMEAILQQWQKELFPNLLLWKLCIESKKIYLDCSAPDYILNILSYCLRKMPDQLMRELHIIMIPQEEPHTVVCRMEFPVDTSKNIDPVKDLPAVCNFLIKTKIRIDYNHRFMQDVAEYCVLAMKNILKGGNSTLLNSIMVIAKYCATYSDNASEGYKKIIGMYKIVVSQNPEIDNNPADYFYFPIIAMYCTLRELAVSLNNHADNNDNIINDEDGELALELHSADVTHRMITQKINAKLLKPLKSVLVMLHTKLADQDMPPRIKLLNITPEFKRLLDFYTDPHDDIAKTELSKLLKLSYLTDCTKLFNIFNTKDYNSEQEPQNAEFEEALAYIYRTYKKVYKHYPDGKEKEDCFYFQLGAANALLCYYICNKNWNAIEAYLAEFHQMTSKAFSNSADLSLINLTIFNAQLQLNIARGSLTESITYYQKSLENFNLVSQKIKIVNLKDMANTLQELFISITGFADLGHRLIDALTNMNYHFLAMQITQSATEQFEKQLTRFKNLIKPPARLSPETERQYMRIESNVKKRFRDCYALAEEQYFASLQQCCEKNLTQSLPFKYKHTVNPLLLSITACDLADMKYLQAAFNKNNIPNTLKGDMLILSAIDKIHLDKLNHAFIIAPKLKNAKEHKQQQLPAPEEIRDHQPLDFSYFLDLLKPAGTQLPRNKAHVKNSTKKKNQTAVKKASAAPKPHPTLTVNFGKINGVECLYNEANKEDAKIIALSDDYRPFGLFFGYIDPKLPVATQKHFSKALANRGPNLGHIVTGKGREGVKFFKKSQVKAWKIKIPQQDEFLVGRIVKELEDHDQHGMPIKRFLICFDQVQNHKQEQREQKISSSIEF